MADEEQEGPLPRFDTKNRALLEGHPYHGKITLHPASNDDSQLWKKYGLFIVHLSVIVSQCSFATVNIFGTLAMAHPRAHSEVLTRQTSSFLFSWHTPGKYGMHYIHPTVLLMLRMWGSVPFFLIAATALEKGQHRVCITKRSLLAMGANGFAPKPQKTEWMDGCLVGNHSPGLSPFLLLKNPNDIIA